jgi:hypothetical protein
MTIQKKHWKINNLPSGLSDLIDANFRKKLTASLATTQKDTGEARPNNVKLDGNEAVDLAKWTLNQLRI